MHPEGELTDGLIVQQVLYIRDVASWTLTVAFPRLASFVYDVKAHIKSYINYFLET